MPSEAGDRRDLGSSKIFARIPPALAVGRKLPKAIWVPTLAE
jgi:hypothetical protein